MWTRIFAHNSTVFVSSFLGPFFSDTWYNWKHTATWQLGLARASQFKCCLKNNKKKKKKGHNRQLCTKDMKNNKSLGYGSQRHWTPIRNYFGCLSDKFKAHGNLTNLINTQPPWHRQQVHNMTKASDSRLQEKQKQKEKTKYWTF